jgi:cell division transport system permease protein
MRTWLRHHAQSIADTARRLARQPLATLLGAAAIGVALALPFGAYVLLDNARTLTRHAPGDPEMSVFLEQTATRSDIDRIGAELQRETGVRGVRFVGRDQALADLKRADGLADLVDALKGNPLPDAYVVQLVPGASSAAQALAARVREFPHVAQVQLDSAWVQRVDALLRLGQTAVAVLCVVLAVGLVAVTFNTVRLQILTQAAEIEVAQLVGATDGYIRRPFLYLGSAMGALGAGAALMAVAAGAWALEGDVAILAESYGSAFRLALPGWGDSAALVVFAAALGWTGAYLSVSRHLR